MSFLDRPTRRDSCSSPTPKLQGGGAGQSFVGLPQGVGAADPAIAVREVPSVAHRERGLFVHLRFGHHFFDEREAAGRRLGFQRFAFCSVLRDESDPRRPVAHRELAPFWTARGYRPSGLLAVLDWREVGGTLPVSHRLRFWLQEQ
jgi:hypothetical protein